MPLLSTLGAFNPLSKGGTQPVLSSNYVRYVVSGSPQYYITDIGGVPAPSYEAKTVDVDSLGNSYILCFTKPGSTSGVPGRTVIIQKFLPNGYLSVAKSVVLPTTGDQIEDINIFVDKSSNVPYIGISSYSSVLGRRMTLMAFDNNLNISWNKTYTSTISNPGIFIAKNPASSYIYVTHGNNALYIFNTSGTLINTYDITNVELPLIQPSVYGGGYGPFFVNTTNTKLGSGRSTITLSGGGASVASGVKGTVFTSNTFVVASTLNSSDGYIYGISYHTSLKLSGLYRTNFTVGSFSEKAFVFPDTDTGVEFTGITTDGTYLYVTGTDAGDPTSVSYFLKFDLSFNYINGYRLTQTGAYEVGFNPVYYNNKVFISSANQEWVLPSDMSIPGTGTYVINGITWTASAITTPTSSSGLLTFTSSTAAITTITPTLVSQTLTATAVPNKLIFVGI